MSSDTRQRIVDSAGLLFWRQGYDATGMKQVIETSGAPSGSVYHFFPGGKEDLAAAAVQSSAGFYEALVAAFFDAIDDVADAIEAAFAGAAQTLLDTDFADACPIATVALEMSSRSETVRVACAAAFGGWERELERRYIAGGVPAESAREVALASLSLLEGAFVLGRAHRSTDALAAGGRAAAALVKAARV